MEGDFQNLKNEVVGLEQGYHCDACQKSYSSYSALLDHQRIHSGDRPYECHVCNKTFTQKSHLVIHKRTHTGERPYACHICHKRFSQSSHLKTHKRIHTGEKPYHCDLCGKGFTKKQLLNAHIKLHMRETGRNKDLPFDAASIDAEEVVSASTNDDINTEGSMAVSHEQVAVLQHTFTSREQDYSHLQSELTTVRRRKPATVQRIKREDVDDSATVSADPDLEHFDGTATNVTGSTERIRKTCTSSGDDIEGDVKDELRYAVKTDFVGPETKSDLSTNIKDETACSSNIEQSISNSVLRRTLLTPPKPDRMVEVERTRLVRPTVYSRHRASDIESSVRRNNRISLVDYTADDLLTHLMSRDDVFRCDFCCIIFQDAAMYHLHRSMHDKMDCRCCNMCGKLSHDKYDFIAHFLSEHK